MTYDEFWYKDHNLAKAYRKKYKLERESLNSNMWVQGMYIYEGVAVVLNNAFGKKSGKRLNYPKEPYDLYGERKLQKQDPNLAREDAINQLNILMKKWSK